MTDRGAGSAIAKPYNPLMILTYRSALAALISLFFTFAASIALAQTPATPPPAQAAAVPNPLLKEAAALAGQGKHAEALEVYRRALAADPKLIDAHVGAGQMLDMLGKHEEARQQFRKAIEVAGPEAKDQARTAMAVSYAFESRAADSAKFYEPVFNDRVAAANFTGAAGTANALARVYLESGDFANAEKWYRTGYETSKKIKDLTPAQSDLWQMRWLNAQARIAARRGNAADARTHAAAMKRLSTRGATTTNVRSTNTCSATSRSKRAMPTLRSPSCRRRTWRTASSWGCWPGRTRRRVMPPRRRSITTRRWRLPPTA